MASRKQDRKTAVTSSMEDYLEAIYELVAETDSHEARVSDVATKLGVTRPSVVGMIKHLVEHGLVTHNRYGGAKLTAAGAEIARETAKRHDVLRRFLEEVLGLDAVVAEEDACRMEHALSPETLDRFVALEEFREQGPTKGSLKGESFRKFLKQRNKNKNESKEN